MLLAIDVGNTNTTYAVFNGKDIITDWRVSTNASRTGDEYAAILGQLFRECDLAFSDIDGVVISSVVPASIDPLLRFSRRHLDVQTPLVLSTDIDLGIVVRYHPISDVGADRLANAIAAHAKYNSAVIVVDFGTATTLDAVSASGEYLGGAIAPGIQISLDALLSRAARLTGVRITTPNKAIGETTVSSLQSGVIFGFAGQVDALVDRFKAEMGECIVVATGGLAEVISGESRTIDCCDELLTLEGLRLIYERAGKN